MIKKLLVLLSIAMFISVPAFGADSGTTTGAAVTTEGAAADCSGERVAGKYEDMDGDGKSDTFVPAVVGE